MEGAPSRLLAHPGWTRWGAHVAFWVLYFAVRTAAATADPPQDPMDFPYLVNRLLAVGSYAALTGLLLVAGAGWRARRSSRIRNLMLVLGAIAVAPITQHAEQLWPQMLAGLSPDPYPLVTYLFQFGWVLPLWGLTQALLGYHFETMAQARAVPRAQALAYDAQLKMLHYQINPHFLFNTLHAISTLVLERRNEQAEQMLLRLAGFLRYSLDRQPTEVTQLSAEIEAQRKYLEIERTRFEDKLDVRFSIEAGLENVRLPSLILQPILEPQMSTLAGGTGALIYDAKTKNLYYLDAELDHTSRNPPIGISMADLSGVSETSGRRIGVPGTVAGLRAAAERFGTKKWSEYSTPPSASPRGGSRCTPSSTPRWPRPRWDAVAALERKDYP